MAEPTLAERHRRAAESLALFDEAKPPLQERDVLHLAGMRCWFRLHLDRRPKGRAEIERAKIEALLDVVELRPREAVACGVADATPAGDGVTLRQESHISWTAELGLLFGREYGNERECRLVSLIRDGMVWPHIPPSTLARATASAREKHAAWAAREGGHTLIETPAELRFQLVSELGARPKLALDLLRAADRRVFLCPLAMRDALRRREHVGGVRQWSDERLTAADKAGVARRDGDEHPIRPEGSDGASLAADLLVAHARMGKQPEAAAEQADEVGAVRQAIAERQGIKSGSRAIQAVRAYILGLLSGDVSEREVARRAGISHNAVHAALAAELAAIKRIVGAA